MGCVQMCVIISLNFVYFHITIVDPYFDASMISDCTRNARAIENIFVVIHCVLHSQSIGTVPYPSACTVCGVQCKRIDSNKLMTIISTVTATVYCIYVVY